MVITYIYIDVYTAPQIRCSLGDALYMGMWLSDE